ncbi:DUF2059 domain-containing protein [Epibacterium sp. Ofav1-8]|uniref:DUF2059 domain-containing protein n=1 Tax=Epibacterium sp. Ofav1-8 TaxID=2917735 RepID=UPI001EF5943A|nr:DUF2059 domain-containing protein [Epibacterium sp. Ofav1-8]MCG7622671.1 DUF2059 domain-containing protein [Epibacterium sp. Ofav1-8]
MTEPFSARLRPASVVSFLLHGVFAAALSVAVLLPARAEAADRDQIKAFLEVTGFDVALDSIAQSAGDAPMILGADAGDFGLEWERLTAEVFDTDQMRATALDILEETLSTEALFFAAEFYASDLGQRLVAVENASHMATDGEDTRAAGERIVSSLIEEDDPRVALYQDMNLAIGGTETALRAVQEIQFRFLMAASAAGVIDMQIDAEGLRALMKAQEDEMRREMAASSLAHSAYLYRDFTTEEVATYVEALEHPLMQEVYELLNAIQYEIQANRFEELAHRMRDLQPVQEL